MPMKGQRGVGGWRPLKSQGLWMSMKDQEMWMAMKDHGMWMPMAMRDQVVNDQARSWDANARSGCQGKINGCDCQ